MHLLCYIAHLRFWIQSLIRNEILTPLCLSLIPEGYVIAAQTNFSEDIAEKFFKWFRSAFSPSTKKYIPRNSSCEAQVPKIFSKYFLYIWWIGKLSLIFFIRDYGQFVIAFNIFLKKFIDIFSICLQYFFKKIR